MTDRLCAECRKTFTARQYNAAFCGPSCRQAFNNRRATRGALLYDLVMAPDPAGNLADLRKRVVGSWRVQDEANGKKRTHKRVHDILFDVEEVLRT